jgi:hypothetical protein
MKKYFLIAVIFISCNIVGWKNQNALVKVGEYYELSKDWYNDNPFEPKKIDTVKVIAISGKYVQYETKLGYKASTDLRFFKNRMRPNSMTE